MGSLITDEQIGFWVNDGKNRLGSIKPQSITLSWAALASTVSLPSDFINLSHVRLDSTTLYMPPYEIWGTVLRFTETDGASTGGGCTAFYWAMHPDIDAQTDSQMPPAGDQAAVNWCCHRFFRRMANSRAEYRRYATMVGANGVTVDDIRELAAEYLQDYNDARGQLEIPGETGFIAFYG
jgi:hypothetical protein